MVVFELLVMLDPHKMMALGVLSLRIPLIILGVIQRLNDTKYDGKYSCTLIRCEDTVQSPP